MKKINDGWHTISGQRVYVESGKVMRGMKKDRNGSWLPAHVYRGSRFGGLDNEDGYNTVDAFRAGVKRGTITVE